MSLFSQPILAVLFGAFIACAETCLHFENIVHPTSWIDLPLHDWLAAVLLNEWISEKAFLGILVGLLLLASLAAVGTIRRRS